MSEFAPITIDERGQAQIAGGDARLWVKFSRKGRKNHFRSEQEGRPIYENVDYVAIQQPGERDQLVRPVREEDKLRFPKQWAAYQADIEQLPEGTPVKELFSNDPNIVELLRDLKILTVEQLSQLSEAGIQRLGMDGRKYVQRALAYVDRSANMQEVNRLERALADATDRMKVLETANQRMIERMEELEQRQEERQPRPRVASNRAPKAFEPPAPEPPRPDPYVE